ncbi:hypothetical protein [Streptomyces cacaoi]|uniref:hypothetical protein n=1 Tax=Streptomyces cacaoi TaxID=1898 RepID=UPI00263015DC|nr:hypothetical protein [Streptomyces cacaoi]
MSPDLIAAVLLTAPATVLGPICVAGHLITARHDDMALATAVANRSIPADAGGSGEGESLPDPTDLAEVITLHPCRDRAA